MFFKSGLQRARRSGRGQRENKPENTDMKLPKFALPYETLGSPLGDSRTRHEDQRDNRNDDEGNANGEDEEEEPPTLNVRDARVNK
ncbi:hypothetical protein HG530_012815 [Fusarium avenaceum]|nr:hypothetical protein HG530_012815 [Fusarium avenaceum]